MGFFQKNQQNTAKNIYLDKVRPNLVQRDGMKHVVMINSFSKWLNQTFDCESKYTSQIDMIIGMMQSEGYEILDIKFNSIMNQGLFGEMEGFHTLITYK